MVISARNPVHSVLFLILAFFNAAGLFIILGAEFLDMILVVVYVGAVAVLFMFVVMMLDINFAKMRQGFLQYLPLGALIGLVLLAELIFVASNWASTNNYNGWKQFQEKQIANTSNTHAIGNLLYTDYIRD